MATTGMNLKKLYQNEYSFEETINENLFKIESFETLSIKSKIISSTDNNIVAKELYLIDENTDTLFVDKINQIACYNNNLGWIFYQPKRGNIAYLNDEEKFIYYDGTSWEDFSISGGSTGSSGEGSSIDISKFLKKANNLADLADKPQARENLNVYSKEDVYAKSDVYSKEEAYSKDEVYSKNEVYSKAETYDKTEIYTKTEVDEKIANIDTSGSGSGGDTSNCLKKASNLSDLSNVATARKNLNVFSKSETFERARNLADVPDQDTACHNIGTLRDWEIRRCGDYKISAVSYDHDNWYICDGRELSRANYPELFKVLGTTCGAGNGTTTFNIPNFKDKTIWGANGNLNQTKTSGLPNITGSHKYNFVKWGNSAAEGYGAYTCVYKGSPSINTAGGAGSLESITFDASKSNSIYGRSAIVQPPAICVNVFICVR